MSQTKETKDKFDALSVESDGRLHDKLDLINQTQQELEIRKNLLIENALTGNNPSDIIKAQSAITIGADRTNDNRKSIFIDPNSFIGHGTNYREKPTRLSYGLLKDMASTPLVSSIIKTRKNQVAAFSKPQANQFETGFVVRKKGWDKKTDKLNKEDRKEIDRLTEIIINCGQHPSYIRHGFEQFLRLGVHDSLRYDQDNFECIFQLDGRLHSWVQADASTMRVADSFEQQVNGVSIGNAIESRKYKKIAGYYPTYVQVMDNKILADFYPWELNWGVRNPNTDVRMFGYGRSELEDLIEVITNILNSDKYNANFFQIGSAPKGIIRIKGGANNARLQEFRRYWRAQVSGVQNAFRTPVVDAESMEWIDLQKNNKDMEFGRYQEYLIMITCAMYNIAPQEIGFNLSGGMSGNGGGGLFDNNNEQMLQHSSDKGLRPLLRYKEEQINKMIMPHLNPDYEFKFVGIDAENQQTYLDRLVKEVSNYRTVDEVREEAGLKPLPDGMGDIILNPVMLQAAQMKQMQKQQEEMMGGGGDPYAQAEEAAGGGEGGQPQITESPEGSDEQIEELFEMEKALKKGDLFASMLDEGIYRLEKALSDA